MAWGGVGFAVRFFSPANLSEMMIPSLLENVCEPERLDAEEFANLQTAFKIQSGFIMRAAVKKSMENI